MSLTPANCAAALKTKVLDAELIAIDVGSVKCNTMPVSPATPFNVIKVVLLEGGMMVQARALLGGVIVFAPEDSVTISILPGLDVFVAAADDTSAVISPVKTLDTVLIAATAMTNPSLKSLSFFRPFEFHLFCHYLKG